MERGDVERSKYWEFGDILLWFKLLLIDDILFWAWNTESLFGLLKPEFNLEFNPVFAEVYKE